MHEENNFVALTFKMNANAKSMHAARNVIARYENEFIFLFGALCPKFSEQLKDQGYELKNKEKWDKAVFSVVYLHIHDILTDSIYDECLNRIMKNQKLIGLKARYENEFYRNI